MEEKRAYKRVGVGVFANISDGQGIDFEAKVHDLSPKGVSFLSDSEIESGKELKLVIILVRGNSLTMKVNVVNNSQHEQSGQFKVGVRITQISDDDKLKYLEFYAKKSFLQP